MSMDTLVAINGKAVKTMDELVEDIESKRVGESIEVTILREGKKRTVKVHLSEMPSGQ